MCFTDLSRKSKTTEEAPVGCGLEDFDDQRVLFGAEEVVEVFDLSRLGFRVVGVEEEFEDGEGDEDGEGEEDEDDGGDGLSVLDIGVDFGGGGRRVTAKGDLLLSLVLAGVGEIEALPEELLTSPFFSTTELPPTGPLGLVGTTTEDVCECIAEVPLTAVDGTAVFCGIGLIVPTGFNFLAASRRTFDCEALLESADFPLE